jgi:hypothetical protein
MELSPNTLSLSRTNAFERRERIWRYKSRKLFAASTAVTSSKRNPIFLPINLNECLAFRGAKQQSNDDVDRALRNESN